MADGSIIINPDAAQCKAKHEELLEEASRSEADAVRLIKSVSPRVSLKQSRPAVSV